MPFPAPRILTRAGIWETSTRAPASIEFFDLVLACLALDHPQEQIRQMACFLFGFSDDQIQHDISGRLGDCAAASLKSTVYHLSIFDLQLKNDVISTARIDAL